MKKHIKVFHGKEVMAYNDSNAEWVVAVEGNTPQRFDKRKWTMKDAMELTARTAV